MIRLPVVTDTRSAEGLRALADAIRPTAADYAAHAACGTIDQADARAWAAAMLYRAASVRGWRQRASLLRAYGFEVAL